MRNKIFLNLLFLSLLLAVFYIPREAAAQQASFYVSPSKGSYSVGSTFYVDVFISAEGIAINASQATISFPADKLQVTGLSKSSSIFSLWVEEPVFSNATGKISFLGGVPNPGFIGSRGKVITILFKGKAAGTASINFSGEKILANDPYGTNIFSSSQGGTYTIVVPEKLPPTEEKPPTEKPEADTQPPNPFEIILDNEGNPTNPRPLLYFEAKDDISGISHYEVKIKGEVFKVNPGENFPWRTPVLSPDNYQIFVKAFDKAGNFIESSTEFRVDAIKTPQLNVCPKIFRSGDETLFISGTALPNITVTIFFEKNKELIKKWEVTSDKEGDWSLAKEDLFRSGIYEIYAKAKDSRGAESQNSEPCSVKVILGGIAIGPLIISYKNLTPIILIIFIILAIFIAYLLWRIRKTQKLIDTETKDLKTKFYKEYNELRDDIERKLLRVRKVKDLRPSGERGEVTEEELLKDLADVERIIREELQDIEEIN
jgi:F0F1-type ATP synthase assembly protein I